MNLILKIIQGPNAGAEVALVEGINVKLGRGDECDIVLNDQALPEVACELEVGAERVTMLLPGGAQERLEPLHVKVFETTAIAIGPGDGPWGQLIWPDPAAPAEEEQPQEPEPEKPKPRWRKLQWTLLVVLILVVVLEFVVWIFKPAIDSGITRMRNWGQSKYAEWTRDPVAEAATPYQRASVTDLAKVYGVKVVVHDPESGDAMLTGNLKSRAERLRLVAEAYAIQPGIRLDLADEETIRNAAAEVLRMVAGEQLEVAGVAERTLELSGKIDGTERLAEVLEALRADVPGLEHIDCSKVTLGTQEIQDAAAAAAVPADATAMAQQQQSQPKAKAKTDAGKKRPTVVAPARPELPVVGVMLAPFPCLVLRSGARIMEGGEFAGYTVEKIGIDAVVLRRGTETLQWRP